MTVTDGDRLAVAVAKFDEAAQLVQQGRKIIEYLFELGEVDVKIPERSGGQRPQHCAIPDYSDADPDPVTGLYPGQQQDPALQIQMEDEESEECEE